MISVESDIAGFLTCGCSGVRACTSLRLTCFHYPERCNGGLLLQDRPTNYFEEAGKGASADIGRR